jgi:Co/Zn/Cd efflux system component
MNKSVFSIPQMDCSAEEQLIKMKLEGISSIKQMDFDIPGRSLTIFHEAGGSSIEYSLAELKLGAKLSSTGPVNDFQAKEKDKGERKLLIIVFLINAGLFFFEMLFGFLSHSMGLVADSLDMLADAFVFGLSLMVVGAALAKKQRVAKFSGYFQLILALLGFAEVIRRFIGHETLPDFMTMIIVSGIAFAGNVTTLFLLKKQNSEEVHMKASWIFTSNDLLANLGTLIAGIIIHFTTSSLPDLIIGTVIFFMVMKGALRILSLSKN